VVTVTRPREIWNMDRNNGRFRWVCAALHVAHEVASDRDLEKVWHCTN